jgi:2-keto-4-pentenoate hydratase/2-oxohepta-3-ene-1,7-dioic acid hydratase in catechol pathway
MKWVRFTQENSICWGHLEADNVVVVHSGPPFDPAHHPTVEHLTLADVELLPPCVPSKIVCIGRNYREHAQELGNELPSSPLFFLKPPSAIIGAGQPIVIPALSQRVDYEGELAVIVGKRCRHFQPSGSVAEYVFGYSCLNDITARDLQKQDSQWARAKGFDTFCPLGPWIESSPRKGPQPWDGLALETRVNGELRQRGNTRDFIFSLPDLLRAISEVMTLEPGDVVATGTPAGVGALKPGDHVTVTIDGIGSLENPVRAAA